MVDSGQMHVLIIGAGITGVALAQGLKKAGIPYTIYEAEEKATHRPREWTMALHWALPFLEEILPPHLLIRLREAYIDASLGFNEYPNNCTRIFDGTNGQLLLEMPLPDRNVRVTRKKLRSLCSQGLDIKYGHALRDVEVHDPDQISVMFTNGASAMGTLVVGADGPRSSVRTFIHGAEKARPTPLDFINVNMTFTYSDPAHALLARSAHPVFSMMHGRSTLAFITVVDVPDPEKPGGWRFQFFGSFPGDRHIDETNEDRRARIKARANDLAEPFSSAVHLIPDDADFAYQEIGCWVPEQYDTREGRIVLAGDAAHSMPPHRGQGLNQALQDAYDLVQVLKQVEEAGVGTGSKVQSELIQEVAGEIVRRGANEVQMSMQSASMSMSIDSVKESAFYEHSTRKMHEQKQTPGVS